MLLDIVAKSLYSEKEVTTLQKEWYVHKYVSHYYIVKILISLVQIMCVLSCKILIKTLINKWLTVILRAWIYVRDVSVLDFLGSLYFNLSNECIFRFLSVN